MPPANRRFATTRWSVVIAAGGAAADAREALATLCQAYWYPLYAFVRARGHGADDALDLTQGFFARLLEKNVVSQAAPERGRFRAFLLGAMKNYLANARDHATAMKRGGGAQLLQLDAEDAEAKFGQELAGGLSPERLYERRWALTLLDQVLSSLAAEYARAGKAELFEGLKAHLAGSGDEAPYASVAKTLGMTEGAVKVAVHRMRKRYKERLRAEIAETVDAPEEIDDEIRLLLASL